MDTLTVNARLVAILQQLSELYQSQKDVRRANAFGTAAAALRQVPYPITSGKQALSLPGVGKSTADIIDEYLRTGKVWRLGELQGADAPMISPEEAQKQEVLKVFQTVHGIGPVSAARFYDEGYRTLEQLYANPQLKDAQRLAMYWGNQLNQRIPHAEIDQIREYINSCFAPEAIRWDITGSYRRGTVDSGDVDMLVQSQPGLSMDKVLSLLQAHIIGRFSEGPTKFMGILKMGEQFNAHQLDIRLVEPAAYPAALMYFTGSKEFNVLMRNRALSLGLSLSEYGLESNVPEMVPPIVHSEEEIFAILGVPYLTPAQRTAGLLALPHIQPGAEIYQATPLPSGPVFQLS
jgi:DNA polymerase/3'-5' exonuclease PolX